MISKLARNLVPYIAGEQPADRTYIKLNTNENPYPPSPQVAKIMESFACDTLRRYPSLDSGALRAVIAEKEGVKSENIFVGNGSDEVLGFAFPALFDADKPVCFPDVTYSFYPVYCTLFGLPYRTVPLDARFLLDRKGLRAGGGMVIANPNAPTGLFEDVREFVHADVPVIIDEAYIDFSGRESLAKQAADSENAVVVKTLSKSYALAGLRCGYAVANPQIIDALMRVKDSFNSYSVNAVTQAAAAAALTDTTYFAASVQKVVHTRDAVRSRLLEKGYRSLQSSANFLLVSVPDGDGERAYLHLKENGILVRWFDAPRLNDKLRITVGTDEEMEELLRLL